MSDHESPLSRYLPRWPGGGEGPARPAGGEGGAGDDGVLERMEQFGRGVRQAAPAIPGAYREQVEGALEAAGRLVAAARARREAAPETDRAPSLDGPADLLRRLHFQMVRLRVRHDEMGEDAAREAARDLDALVREAREMAGELNGSPGSPSGR